jgi:hypothetical protein
MRLRAIVLLVLVGAGLVVALMARRPVRSPETGVTHSPASATLPTLGSVITPLPEGSGKSIAERACLVCHSSDMLRQQRLTEKQWTAEITKMIGWGSELTEDERAQLLPYLAGRFGPENDSFSPLPVRPIEP